MRRKGPNVSARSGGFGRFVVVSPPAALVAVLLAAVPACAQDASVYRGSYVTGFETSSFTPCAAEYEGERWWLVADSASYTELRDAAYGSRDRVKRRGEFGRTFARVRGRITEPGRWGHVGGYDREIRVVDVLEVAPPDSAACP